MASTLLLLLGVTAAVGIALLAETPSVALAISPQVSYEPYGEIFLRPGPGLPSLESLGLTPAKLSNVTAAHAAKVDRRAALKPHQTQDEWKGFWNADM